MNQTTVKIMKYLNEKGKMSGADICLDLGLEELDVDEALRTGDIVRAEPEAGGGGPWYAVERPAFYKMDADELLDWVDRHNEVELATNADADQYWAELPAWADGDAAEEAEARDELLGMATELFEVLTGEEMV
ncbi:MAG: hypothetical protein GWN87_24970 [Desulfuromonadales bacterium]|nr:hypothetical protein [Desulfuromonadales bacterium]